MSATQLLVFAKAPVPGRVKTRLCPPCSPDQAALVAAAALADTLAAADAAPVAVRTLVLDGAHCAPPAWRTVRQRGNGLAERLANGYLDSAMPGHHALLIGMDTPQVTPGLLGTAVRALATADAVLGLAEDGGWWALGLRDPADAAALRRVPMSTPDTGRSTLAALRRRGLRVAALPVLSDVDTVADAHRVVAACAPGSAFAAAVAAHVPVAVAGR
ncbi:TIGR04282 family arsenosugar biosynthesis glycosyltransferase [Asanoa iriomotensis]|uniref:Glycosyltransferase n=1 Tax=Asanoa iriomotensis TaxID=234613 RepID=A0ABQ4CEY5_9ACTN|nr:DUF2064 domain-containing protein [Asanoa iriomotensis]GIF60880.1 hypothetical protein Air01nite_69750 [Asanoa iriomotensis]